MIDFKNLFKTRTELINAINTNNTSTLAKLLTQDADSPSTFINLNFLDRDGQTPIHLACKTGNLDIVKLLVKHGASQNIKNNQGWFPIHLATYHGHYDILKFLINEDNFKHQDLIAVYDEQEEYEDVYYKRCPRLRCANVGEKEEVSSDDEEEEESEEDEEEDYENEPLDAGKDGDSLDDLINSLDLKSLELSSGNDRLLLDLLSSDDHLDSSISKLL